MPEGESRGGADISETVATGLLCKNMDHAATDLVSKPADLGRDELAGMQDLPQAWDFFTFSEARGQIPPQAEKSPSHTVGDIVNLGPASQVPPTPQFLLELDQANLSKVNVVCLSQLSGANIARSISLGRAGKAVGCQSSHTNDFSFICRLYLSRNFTPEKDAYLASFCLSDLHQRPPKVERQRFKGRKWERQKRRRKKTAKQRLETVSIQ